MKTLAGIVVSTKMAKTVVVSVERQMVDPLYKKMFKRTRRIKAHNEGTDIHEGDRVRIVASRPYSKDTHYRVDIKE